MAKAKSRDEQHREQRWAAAQSAAEHLAAAGAGALPAKAAAVQRVFSRRRAAMYTEVPDYKTGRSVQYQVDDGSGEFEPPRDLGEWLDDRIARLTPGGVPAVLIMMFEDVRAAAGDLAVGVAAAVRRCAGLSEWDAWHLHMALDTIPESSVQGQELMGLFRAAWKRARLPVRRPDGPLLAERRAPAGRVLDSEAIGPETEGLVTAGVLARR